MLTGDARVQVLAFVERDRLRVRLVVDAALPRDGQVLRICSKDSASKTLACWRSDPIAWSSAELEPCTTQRCLRADPVMHRE
jgi:hypothetical protein